MCLRTRMWRSPHAVLGEREADARLVHVYGVCGRDGNARASRFRGRHFGGGLIERGWDSDPSVDTQCCKRFGHGADGERF